MIFCALSIKIYRKIFGPRVHSKMCENRDMQQFFDFHTFLNEPVDQKFYGKF
jgi:hypothetical protein